MFRSQIPHARIFHWPVGLITPLVLVVTFGVLPMGTAQASTSGAAVAEAAFLADTNAARAAVGLVRYSVSSDLVSVARTHSRAMSASQTLYHNSALTTVVTNWQAVGENVGDGPTEPELQSAFMQSPEHRANILDRDFTQVGIGVVVDSHGTVWVTENFRQPLAVPKAATTPSRPATHTATVVHPAAPVQQPRAVPARPRPAAAHVAASANGPTLPPKPIAPDRDLVAMSAPSSPRPDTRSTVLDLGILLRPEVVLVLLALALTRVRRRALA
jgi:hypothetical protein